MPLATQHPSYFTIVEPSSQGLNLVITGSSIMDVRKPSQLDIIAQEKPEFYLKIQGKGRKEAMLK